ncbi:MAG TPA: ATP-binding cassette domain-containing protein [Acidimicrobiales bacterium]|nr:ATP-binding cassette domain-containing protein [Acidimicrobiales bacterium]
MISTGPKASRNLVVEDLSVELDSGGYLVRPLDGLSFTAKDGELVVVLGPSGCGKTTLLSCLAGLLTPLAGSITFGELRIDELRGAALSAYRRHTVGVVFQAFNLIASLSSRANVVVPLRLAGVGRTEARVRADALLSMVSLADRAGHKPGQLSGGQQQRVAIARALVHDPPLLLADEPTAHLDYIQVEGILRLVREVAAPGRIVVVATHDDRVAQLADRVVELNPAGPEGPNEPTSRSLAAGEMLFEQGERADLVYVVNEGSLEVFRRLASGGEERLAVVPQGGYVGELGPMLNLPRSASVRARERSAVVGYNLRQFRQLVPNGALPGPAPGGDRPGTGSARAGD